MDTWRFANDGTAYANVNQAAGWDATGHLPCDAHHKEPAGMIWKNTPLSSQTLCWQNECRLDRISCSSAPSSSYKYLEKSTDNQHIYNYEASGKCVPSFRPPLFVPTAGGEDSLATSPISNPSASSSPSHIISDDDSTPASWLGGRFQRDDRGNRRREAHTQAEQKRRDEIKKGYQALQDSLPSKASSNVIGTHRVSKATILQSSIDYLQYLTESKRSDAEELLSLKKDLMALQIIKQSYEKISQQISKSDEQAKVASTSISDTEKFRMFQRITEELFHSFDACVNPSSFAELSGSAFSWLEEHCKPTELHDTVSAVLRDVQKSSRSTKELNLV